MIASDKTFLTAGLACTTSGFLEVSHKFAGILG
jgi:hypothetical protein